MRFNAHFYEPIVCSNSWIWLSQSRDASSTSSSSTWSVTINDTSCVNSSTIILNSKKFLLPSSDLLKPVIPQLLDDNKIDYTRAILYKTVCSDLSDLEDVFYDVLVFFSPSGIESLFQNFPNFKQNKTRIAAFGNSTVKAVTEAGLKCDITAPSPETPSMTMALDKYIKLVNKK